jgi:hypothetical protein
VGAGTSFYALVGLGVSCAEENVPEQLQWGSRSHRNRNARPGRLRAVVPMTNAVVEIDLADVKQMSVVTDHGSKVWARKTFRCRACDLGIAFGLGHLTHADTVTSLECRARLAQTRAPGLQESVHAAWKPIVPR